jgi:ankyrin repeat protein
MDTGIWQLGDVSRDILPSFAMKPSVLHSLVSGLETLSSGSSTLAGQAGWLLFQLASSPQFQLLNRGVNECCQILTRLCHLGVPSAQAIVFRYHHLHSKSLQLLDPEWLETSASNGSYYALKSLRVRYPEKYQKLMQSRLSFEPDLTHLEEHTSLLRYCRQGDYAGCKMLLSTGVSAFPIEEDMVSPLHWLVSFQDEDQINDLLKLLLENGAVIDAWEGEKQDFTFGRAAGTPLHWAVWYRNIPVLRALIKVDSNPKVADLNRALLIAAGMHFYDALDILKIWILSLKHGTRAQCDWKTALICAAENSICHLPRRLRHGDRNLPRAFESTMDIMLTVQMPSEEDVKILFQMALPQNNELLLRYMFGRLNLGRRDDILHNHNFDAAVISIAMGLPKIFEICIENELLSPESEHGTQKWKALQVCCFTRQRDPTFARRLLEIGCAVDGAPNIAEDAWTPFAIAVSVGLYHIAVVLLEHGADKDHLSGWLGGSTITMNLLQNWPDIPISRLKFLLEEIPRLGFGHVTFWGWPGAGGNLLYALSLNHWSAYTAGYRLGETAKYILSQLADKSCLNRIDKVGSTALRMACANGNLEICRALIEAGQDVNLALGFSPLGNAKEWMKKCRERERAAMANRNSAGSERRLAKTLRQRAEQTVQLMVENGAIDRGFFESLENTRDYVMSGQWQRPSFEVSKIILSYICLQMQDTRLTC